MPSFDVTSEVDYQEVRNAMDQAAREVATRFDFRDTNSAAELGDQDITIRSMSEDRLRAVRQVVEEKLVKRKVSLKALDWGTIEAASGGTVRQVGALVAGINSDKAREVNKFVKNLGIKGVQTQTQGEQVRVMAKKRDHLQQVIAALREHDFGIPIDTGNFRD
ncbi:MAG: YajQ family cyclic di-GMP-binding protein [Microthrixaceae bacterium]